MKRLLALLLALCLVFAFAACGNKDSGDIDKESYTKTEQKVDKEDEEEEEEFSIIGTWKVTVDMADVVWDDLMTVLDHEAKEAVEYIKKGELEYVMTYKFGKKIVTAKIDSSARKKIYEDLKNWIDIDKMFEIKAAEVDMDVEDFKADMLDELDMTEEELEEYMLAEMGIDEDDYIPIEGEKSESEYELDGNTLYIFEEGEGKYDSDAFVGDIEIINNNKFKFVFMEAGIEFELVFSKK